MHLVPDPSLTSVTATGFEDEFATDDSWSVHATPMCATGPPGLQRAAATSQVGPEAEFNSVTATCPAGKNLLGTGGEVPGGFGVIVIDEIRPDATLTAVTVTGVRGTNTTGAGWSVTAYAICANP
jgi:hypothetical protein